MGTISGALKPQTTTSHALLPTLSFQRPLFKYPEILRHLLFLRFPWEKGNSVILGEDLFHVLLLFSWAFKIKRLSWRLNFLIVFTTLGLLVRIGRALLWWQNSKFQWFDTVKADTSLRADSCALGASPVCCCFFPFFLNLQMYFNVLI